MDIKTIAYNAIDHMLCECAMTIEQVCDHIGCTKTELIEYGLIEEDE
jgi:hypothetical protein